MFDLIFGYLMMLPLAIGLAFFLGKTYGTLFIIGYGILYLIIILAFEICKTDNEIERNKFTLTILFIFLINILTAIVFFIISGTNSFLKQNSKIAICNENNTYKLVKDFKVIDNFVIDLKHNKIYKKNSCKIVNLENE